MLTPRSSTVLQAAAAGLAADPGPVVDAIRERPEAATFVRQLLEAGELPEEVLSTLIEILAGPLQRQNKLSLYESWERVRELGQRSAAGGLPLEELLEVITAVREEVVLGLTARGLEATLLQRAERRLEEAVEKVASALTRGYLDETDQRYQAEHRELLALINLARALNSSLDVQAVAEAGLLQTLRVMGLQAGAVWMRQEGELRLLKSAGLAPQREREDQLEMQALVEKGSRLVAAALHASVPIQGLTPSELKTRANWSVAATSLRAKGELAGVMTVATRQPRVFSESEMEFVATVADHLAVALERAREHSLEARTDHLTGLANRPEFERAMERAIAAAQRHRRPLTLMLIDLDNLKEINDTYGHQAGDEAIRTVARGLHAAVRSSDTCARVGGDEFALAMPEADLRQAYDVAERVRRALEAVNAGARIPVEFSLGLAAWEPGLDWSQMYRLADQRLYRDKKRHHTRESSARRA